VSDSTDVGAPLTRRRLLHLSMTAAAAALSAACTQGQTEEDPSLMATRRQRAPDRQAAEGRLLARPVPPVEAVGPGLHPLRLGTERDGLLYVPAGYRAERPAPLALMLHGAGGSAEHGLSLLRPHADAAGLVLLAPASRRETWDVILGRYGPDVAFIDQALARTFRRCAVDAARVAVGGFSDGASYALSLGITNGDLFTHVIALSPGFMAPQLQHGSPRIYISHGTRDQVLPIEVCSRRLVPQLQRAGYDVRYHEFEGRHTVPPEIAREATSWFIGS
jgi:phospholipase/carboxylesterase